MRYWGINLPAQTPARYGVAVMAAACAIAARGAMHGVLGIHAPYVPSELAVTIAALAGGRGPGMLAAGLTTLGTAYLFIEPRFSFAIAGYQPQAGLALFVVTALLSAVLVGHLRELLLFTARAESALRDSESQFHTLANAIPQLCWMANPDGWIFWYNDRWYTYTGTTPEQMKGWGWRDVHDPAVLPRVLELWQSSIATGEPFEMVFPLRRFDGAYGSFLTRIVPVRNEEGRILRWFGTNTDISEQHRTEEALRQSEARYSVLAEALPAIVFTASADGRIDYINRRWCEFSALPAEQMKGQDPAYLAHPDDQGRVREAWEASVRTGAPFEAELRRQAGNGGYRRFNVRATALRDGSGAVTKWLGVSYDIEDQKQAEERARSSQKLEALGTLAGGVAHDFNNLLTVIGGYNAMVMKHLENAPVVLGYAEQVESAANRAADLTRHLLAFSRRQVTQPKTLNLNRVVESMGKLLKRLLGEHIELVFRLAPDAGAIRADPIQADQVIMNLSVNARDAMPDGGTLTFETARLSLDDREARQLNLPAGDYAALTVSDTGSGMDAATKSRLFEPYFTTKEPGKGTGLGLAIVYGAVSQSGGAIHVESELGRGTTFRIYFPQCPAEENVAMPAGAALEKSGGETILLAEDEHMVRELVATMLSERGFSVLSAATPGEAIRIAAAAEQRIDLLLSDVLMPEMRGPELARRVRELRPDVSVIFMSGYSDRTFIDPGALRDAGFLQKPFHPEELARKIREALEHRRSRYRIQ